MALHFISILLLCLLSSSAGVAQSLRFPAIERRHDVVVLVADASTGRLLGGIRTSEGMTERYDPGSVFKLAIALAALRTGAVPANESFTCNGSASFDQHDFKCWKESGHGTIGLESGLARSCNLFFRWLASNVPDNAVLAAARDLGIDDPAGTVDPLTPENYLGEAWSVTPHQMLRAALTLASRGRLAPAPVDLAAARYLPLYRGLRECARTGTARAVWSRHFTVGGKTGTASHPDAPRRRVGWFIGFAPYERPRYAIAVLHRRGMGSDAALIARSVLSSLL